MKILKLTRDVEQDTIFVNMDLVYAFFPIRGGGTKFVFCDGTSAEVREDADAIRTMLI